MEFVFGDEKVLGGKSLWKKTNWGEIFLGDENMRESKAWSGCGICMTVKIEEKEKVTVCKTLDT